MYKQRILWGVVLIIYVLFAFFELSEQEYIAGCFKSVITPIIALIYFVFSKNKTLYFSLFIFCFALSDLLYIVNLGVYYDFYYIGNALYVLAYLSLFIEVSKSICFKYIIKNFKIRLIVLVVLNFYMLYFLYGIVNQELTASQLCLELIYNVIMLALLSISLLNYFFRDNRKSFYLFVGVLLCVLSEVINVSNMYSIGRHFLSVVSIALSVIGFYFLCRQTGFVDEQTQDVNLLKDNC